MGFDGPVALEILPQFGQFVRSDLARSFGKTDLVFGDDAEDDDDLEISKSANNSSTLPRGD